MSPRLRLGHRVVQLPHLRVILREPAREGPVLGDVVSDLLLPCDGLGFRYGAVHDDGSDPLDLFSGFLGESSLNFAVRHLRDELHAPNQYESPTA